MGYFSAVCWFFGRQISDALSPTHAVPVGLIANTWGGTQIAQWMPSPAFARCNQSISSNGGLYNAMIHPYVVGPMSIAGFTWYQVSFPVTSVPIMAESWSD